jgi:5,6,7,8-tetrahydromethanopterin hydro-lyase
MSDSIDGRIGEAWSGTAPNGSHVNVVLARRGTAIAAAAVSALALPAKGHTPILVCLGAGTPVWPPTIMTNKATVESEELALVTWGGAQLGIGEGVLDAVAEELLVPDGETLVLVAVWVDPAASDQKAVRAANRDAVGRAVRKAVKGPADGEVDRLLRERGTLVNGFYSEG